MAGDATAGEAPSLRGPTTQAFLGVRRMSRLPRVPRGYAWRQPSRAQEPAMQSPTAARRRMTDLNRRTHLLEREAELEQIGDALHTSAAGSGRIVVIDGAPGIGKSSLLDEAAELAEAARMAVLRARGGVMEREFALGVVIQVLAPSIEPLTEDERERVFAGAAGLGAAVVRGGSRSSGSRRSPVRTVSRAALAVREAGRRAAACLPRRRCALGRRAFASIPRLSRGEDRGDAGLRDPRGPDGRAAAPEALTKLIEGEPSTAVRRHR